MAGQGASSGGRKSAGNEYVKFTRPAAARIASVVREVERGNRSQSPLTFEHPMPAASQGVVFRMATFTGGWDRNTAKPMTFLNVTTTPNTAMVTNLLYQIPTPIDTAYAWTCAIGKEGTAWHLLVPMHNLETYTLVGPILTTSALQFTRMNINVIGENTATTAISVSNCSTQQASSQSFNYFLG